MPETPGCASTIGEIALPSLVSPVSRRAVEVRRFSRDGKVLHPPIRPGPRQRAKMYSATVRTFIASLRPRNEIVAVTMNLREVTVRSRDRVRRAQLH